MTPHVAMLLGNTVWTRSAGGWRHESTSEHGGDASDTISRLATILTEASAERAIVVFEPVGIDHQTVDMPRVNRTAFASLERVRSDHPVVDAENLGWGIESPEPGPGGSYSTLLHSEATPNLIRLRDKCARSGCKLSAAWAAFTVAFEMLKSGASMYRAKTVLVLTQSYSAIAVFGGGKRSYKGWVGPISEREWKIMSALIGDFDPRLAPNMADAVSRKGAVYVVSEGQPEAYCPFWMDLRASGRLEAVLDIESFAGSAARISPKHPANLLEAFPSPRELDRTLLTGGMGGIVAAITLGSLAVVEGNQHNAMVSEYRARAVQMERRIKGLEMNGLEAERIRDNAPDAIEPLAPRKYEALVGLSDAIPDEITITSLAIGRDGSFELEAILVGGDFDQEKLLRALTQHGFTPAAGKGWVWEPGLGRLRINGRYLETQP